MDPSPELLSLAALQAGALSAEQTAAHGLGRHSLQRLIGQGQWQRMSKGIYLASPAQPVPWEAQAWAGVLLGGPASRIGGLAGGHLIGLNEPPDLIDVMVPWSSVLRSRDQWRFVRERALVRSPRSVGDPPRLEAADLVLDLSDDADEAGVLDLVTRALQQRLVTFAELRRAVARRSRLRHRRWLLELLHEVADGAETPLEIYYRRDVEQAHGLPRGDRQLTARRGRDQRDVTYVEVGVVVELDGRIGHRGAGRFRDYKRDNYAATRGEVAMRYGWWDVREIPCAVAFQLADVMIQRGWQGLPCRCPHCRAVTDFDII